MNFFYKAIQRSTGQPVAEEPEPELQPVETPVHMRQNAAAAPAMAPPMRAGVRETVPAESWQPGHVLSGMNPDERLVVAAQHSLAGDNIGAVEHYRNLRTRLLEVARLREAKTLLITSPGEAEGKTLTSLNISFSLSHLRNLRVLLIDADLRKPSVSKYLSMKPEKGLNTVLKEGHDIREALWRVGPTFDLIPSFGFQADSAELLSSERMKRLIASARANYDLVILDAPPVFPIADSSILAGMVDGAVLLVRANSTDAGRAKEAGAALGSKLIASVLNGMPNRRGSSKYYENSYYGAPRTKGAAAGKR